MPTNQKIFKEIGGDKLKISRERRVDKAIYIDFDLGYFEFDLEEAKRMTEHLLLLIKQQDPNYNPEIKNMYIDFKGDWVPA